jgi:hypothetical protein
MNTISTFPESALVLVAVMPSPKDMEIARLLGWYRIPMRMAPKIIDVDALLFYQTAKFPKGHASIIEAYAEVKGYELTTRSELIRNELDHPRANEEYYKINLGPIIYLSNPIQANTWKRITFFYTLGNLVNQAKIINDLVVSSDERDILWKTICERGLAGYSENHDDSTHLTDPEMLKLLQQVITLNMDLDLNFIKTQED